MREREVEAQRNPPGAIARSALLPTCTGCRFFFFVDPIPSTVTTDWPSTEQSGARHALTDRLTTLPARAS